MVGPTVSMFDIHVPCMSTYGPRYIPSKNLFGYLGKFPLGGLIPIFRRAFLYGTLPPSRPPPPFPPPSRAQSSELPSNEPVGIIKAQAISRFLRLELRCS